MRESYEDITHGSDSLDDHSTIALCNVSCLQVPDMKRQAYIHELMITIQIERSVES